MGIDGRGVGGGWTADRVRPGTASDKPYRMTRLHLSASVLLSLLSCPADLQGQEVPAVDARRLGVFFWHDSPNDLATFAGIREGLRQARLPCTFVEQRADSDPGKAKAALAALRTANCDLVFAMGTQAALLARDELKGVPVVFAAVSAPVASGVVRSWEGSGTNLCGGSNWIAPQSVLEVFRLAVPSLKRLGILRSEASGVVSAAEQATMRAHLATLPPGHLELYEAVTTDATDIDAAVAKLLAAQVDAIWIPIDISIYRDIPAVRKALGGAKVPLLTTAAAGVRGGAIVGAVVDYSLHGRRTAALALDVLLHGKDPATLPIDRMHGAQIVVNLAAARQTGIDLPLSLLAVADELIDPEITNAGR